jgi:hypothetical protein
MAVMVTAQTATTITTAPTRFISPPHFRHTMDVRSDILRVNVGRDQVPQGHPDRATPVSARDGSPSPG